MDYAQSRPTFVVQDDFFVDPDAVRVFALAQKFAPSDGSPGYRSVERFHRLVDPDVFGRLLHRKITRWEEHGANGRLQFCTARDPIVYHSDSQSHAGVIFLTPNAPAECGLSMFRSKVTGLRRPPQDLETEASMYGVGGANLFDRSKWEEIDRIGNLYNRLILWDGRLVHAASAYFGSAMENCRLFQVFFFDAE